MQTDNQEDGQEPSLTNGADDESTPVRIEVRKSLSGKRLDKYLHGRLSRFSRTALQRLIKEGHVLVDGRTVKPSYEIHGGEIIETLVPPSPPTEIQGENIPLDIIWEDEHLIALNKQAGIVVHPARGIGSGTLVNGLVYYAESLSTGSAQFRPGIVHRLDKDTTGVMLIAKNDEAHWRVAQQFENRTVHKTYLAVAQGEMELLADLIDLPLGMHPVFRDRCAVRTVSGKPAQTSYKVLEKFRGYTLLALKPRTGRTHQLRVHLSHLKHPLVGDRIYGGSLVSLADLSGDRSEPAEPIIDRQALHAWKIEFAHPVTAKPIKLEAPWPPDLTRLIEALRKYRPQP